MCLDLFSYYFDLVLFRIDDDDDDHNNNNNDNNFYNSIKVTLKMFNTLY